MTASENGVDSSPVLRPVELLHYFGRVHRDVWRRHDRVLDATRDAGASWPVHIHAPDGVADAVVAQEKPTRALTGVRAQPDIIAALSAWRPTQGIYRFHPTLFNALWDTPVSGELPAELVHRLPEWCVYIETPGRQLDATRPIHGFFAHIGIDGGSGREELRILLDMAAPFPMLDPQRVPLMGTLEDGLDAVARELHPEIPFLQDHHVRHASALAPLVSLLLYLCVEDPDLRDVNGKRDRPRRPTPKEAKRKGKRARLIAAKEPTVWETAFTLGARLDAAAPDSGVPSSSGTGNRTVRPHVRRAHWHTYWTGPRDTAHRRATLKWMSPLLIKADGERLPTVRKVR